MEKEDKKGVDIEKELTYKKRNFFEASDEKKIGKAYEYGEDYKKFLDASKTEREAVATSVKYAEKNGFKPYVFGEKLKAGDKKYYNNRDKSLVLFVVGSENISEG
ncbi:MAG TPA: aminopeptidase, partial [Clostridiales bacterium]|nr:aminopeptidase [Clostridiales bacterium]